MERRLPRSLTPRRKYEVDENNWLVIHFGPFVRRSWRFLYPLSVRAYRNLRIVPMAVRWHRWPRAYELAFVNKMDGLRDLGIAFSDVLRATLPGLIGEAPTDVMRRWVGLKAWTDPEHFALAMDSTFGKSGKMIVTGVDRLVDPDGMLAAQQPTEPMYKSLVEAIERADSAAGIDKGLLAKDLPRWDPAVLAAYEYDY